MESFLRLYSSSIASQICGTFTAQLRHRDTAIPRLVFGDDLWRREWQWRRKSSHVTTTTTTTTVVAGEVILTVHPCALSAWSTNLLCLPTTYLPTYLPTYIPIHTSFALAGSLPRPASIARICITRTCLSIALPQLASSPRLLPSRTEKGETKKKTLDHPRLSPPRSQWSTRDPTVLVSRCTSVGLCLHWYRNDTRGCYSKRNVSNIVVSKLVTKEDVNYYWYSEVDSWPLLSHLIESISFSNKFRLVEHFVWNKKF